MVKRKIHFSHANGFPAESYREFIGHLSSDFDVQYLNALGLGEYKVNDSWTNLADELIAHLDNKNEGPVIGVGHSLGGVVTLFAANKRPDLFEKIVIIDSPIFNAPMRLAMGVMKKLGLFEKVVKEHQLAVKRKDLFKSREEAFSYFRQKHLFRDFSDNVLWDYVNHGLKETEKGYELYIPKEVEASVFKNIPHSFRNIKLEVPGNYIYSENFEILKPIDVRWLKRTFSDFTFTPARGGHLMPFEYPEDTAELLKKVLQ